MTPTLSLRPSLAVATLALLTLAACVAAPPPAPAPAPVAPEPPAVEAVETAEPEHKPNTLRWTTASEVDNFGFDVYRGDSEDGPFARLTERPISGAGTTDLTTDYSFEDMTNDPYLTYYYYVESISLQGEREQFTPIIKAGPKLTREDDDEDSGDDGAAD